MITTIATWLRRDTTRPYDPLKLHPDMFGHFDLRGDDLVESSKNYHEATLGWMMGVGTFQQIRLGLSHRLRLIDADWGGTTANRARGHRRENIYRVAIALHLSGEIRGRGVGMGREVAMDYEAGDVWGPETLMPMLASDFDNAFLRWQARGDALELAPRIIRLDAHGREL